jgi:hypothetical protein
MVSCRVAMRNTSLTDTLDCWIVNGAGTALRNICYCLTKLDDGDPSNTTILKYTITAL